MGLFSWLAGGNDHALADSSYAGQESASDRASRQRREGHRRSIRDAADAGEKWEREDRKRDRQGTSFWSWK